MEALRQLLQECLQQDLYQIVLSGTRTKGEDAVGKKKIRPVLIKNALCFQTTSYVGKQVFHKNGSARDTEALILADFPAQYKQMQIDTKQFTATVLSGKKGNISIRKKLHGKDGKKQADLSHNRVKRYILEEGRAVPFLVDLGVQTRDGKTVQSRYDKFRQINRFLEFVEDVLDRLPTDRPVRVIDFGCGKSYLTFAMYYYLHELQKRQVRMTGLDLKADVIAACSQLAEKYGYDQLDFVQGDIAAYKETENVDMVVTLHACDTATDYALYQAICWKAKVILSVPCCQHEVNGQIACGALEGALKYGLIRERMSALFTDALRANLLEESGYDTQVIEFIDMEHTPKNILLRAVYTGKKKPCKSRQLAETLHVHTTLQKLLENEKTEQFRQKDGEI